jgi:polyvinyl alcohol dehydrogenase (cytochrome)
LLHLPWRHRGARLGDWATGLEDLHHLAGAKVIKTNSAGVDYMGPSGAGVWTTPIVDTRRRALYFGTGNAFTEPATTADSIMAVSMDTGKILWWQQALANDVWHGGCNQTIPGRGAPPRPPPQQAAVPGRGTRPPYPPENCVEKTGPDWDYAASPNLATLPDGRTVIIASPKQAVVRALDPDKNGATIWEQDIARGIGGGAGETVFGGAVDDQTVYFGLHLGNGLVALNLATGVEKWFRPLKNPDAMASHRGIVAAVSVIPGVFFAGGMDGILRAVSPVDGSSIWEFDTAQEFKTVNGIAAKGGVDRSGWAQHREWNGICRLGIRGLSERRSRQRNACLCASVLRGVRWIIS